MSARRRLGVGFVAAVLLLIFLTVAWLDLQAHSTGILDMALMGATLAGGGVAAFSAITGKEQRRTGPR